MSFLTLSSFNADRVAVGYVDDVSEELSASTLGFSEQVQNGLKLKKQEMKRRGRKEFGPVGEQVMVVNTALVRIDSFPETSQLMATLCKHS